MANILTLEELNSYQILLDNGDISGFYDAMLNNAYAYAGWAVGVAEGDTIAGRAALDFLNDSAMLGAIGANAEALSSDVIENIKIGMAQAYLDTLITIAENNGGYVSRDVNAQEVWKFHEDVFVDNGLSIENWTLDTPFTIFQSFFGDSTLEEFWQLIRDTEGTGLDAIHANLTVAIYMRIFATDPFDSATEVLAEDWLSLVFWEGEWFTGTLGVTLETVAGLFSESKELLVSQNLVNILFSNIVSLNSSTGQQAQINSLVNSVGNENVARHYIDSLRKLFFGSGISNSPVDDLNALMVSVASVIADDVNSKNFTIDSLVGKSSSQIIDLANDNIAYRYALINLNPFVIIGDNTLYQQHNQNGELSAENFSEQYLADRANMLQWLIKYNYEGVDYGEYLAADGFDGNVTYTDLSSETNNGQDLVLKIDGDGVAIPYEQIKFGTEYDDGIAGADNDDRLYGGGGKDAILGKDGDDYIEGGKGNDTMSGGDGDDTFIVQDSGDTVIELDGEGDDTVYSHVDFTLSDNSHVETIRAVDEESLQQSITDNVDLTGSNTFYLLAMAA